MEPDLECVEQRNLGLKYPRTLNSARAPFLMFMTNAVMSGEDQEIKRRKPFHAVSNVWWQKTSKRRESGRWEKQEMEAEMERNSEETGDRKRNR